MADRAPAFQFYPRDFLGDLDVAALTLEEIGAYTLLLCYSWLKDGLPPDQAKLARALRVPPAKYARLWSAVAEKFCQDAEGRWRNARQEEERAKQAEWREKSSRGGRKGQAGRNHHSTTVEPPLQPPLQPNGNTSSSSAFASASASAETPAVSMPHTRLAPLGVRSRVDVAWPGRPPVPGSLHADFRQKLGGDPNDADARLRAWYPTVAAQWEGQVIADDDFRFWRARFKEWAKGQADEAALRQFLKGDAA